MSHRITPSACRAFGSHIRQSGIASRLARRSQTFHQSVRFQHEQAVVGTKRERHPNDEFSIIEQKTRERLQKPKRDRPPFLKNIFVRKIDPRMLEYPELTLEELDKINSQVDPIREALSQVHPGNFDKNATIANDVLADVANKGAFVHRIPRLYNGNGLDNVGFARLVESLSTNGHIAIGVLAYAQGSWVSQLILQYGSEDQKNYFLPQMADGSKLFAFAAHEKESGNHIVNITSTVRMGSDNRGYILSGKKSWVINAPKSDYFLVIAKHEGLGLHYDTPNKLLAAKMEEEKTGSMSAFIVPRKAPGVKIGDRVDFVGLKGLQVSEVEFENVALPLDSMLGRTGDGFKLAMQAMTGERHVLACTVLPLLKKMLADATKYAISRKVFNQPIYKFDLVREKLGEVACYTYALESMTYLTALLMDQTVKPDFDIESATVRVFAADLVPRAITLMMQIYGAMGVEANNDLELHLRDALTLFQVDGGTDMARMYITLSALKYAGASYLEDVQRRTNPFNFPDFNERMRKMFTSKPKRTAFLEDFVHPTLMMGAQALEETCMKLGETVEFLILERNKSLFERQMDLRRLSEIMTLVYGGFATLGRASRSYCLGIKNSDHELNMALMFVQLAKKKTNELCQDIEDESNVRDPFSQQIVDLMVNTKSFGCEHALARNF